uniref:borealin n=1 Tax=Myxine glutinosa TaxID=7769 RepID=UPI00358FCF2D
MAPKRRATRNSVQKTIAARQNEEEKKKFQIFLRDFNDQVEVFSRKGAMELEGRLEQCNRMYEELLMTLPTSLLKMPIVAFQPKLCGNKDAVNQEAAEANKLSQHSTEDAAEIETRTTKMTPSSKAATNRRLPAKRTRGSKKENMAIPSMTSNSSEREEVLQTKKRTCKMMCTTPQQQMKSPWPLRTPGLRKARRGEQLFTISINGSPVVTAQQFAKTMAAKQSKIDNSNESLRPETLQKVKFIQKTVNLLKKPE